eukprot:COSAG02_NODE_41436_length_394_cov_1.569492_1_plen_44_part_10
MNADDSPGSGSPHAQAAARRSKRRRTLCGDGDLDADILAELVDE